MKIHFDQDWKNWIRGNIETGKDKDGIFKILLDEGYDFTAIKNEMAYEPSVPAVLIVNPLKAKKERDSQAKQSRSSPSPLPALFLPHAKKMETTEIELYQVEGFLNPQECAELITLIKHKMQPSTLSSHEDDRQFRTSSTCYLGHMDDPLIGKIDRQICQDIGIEPSYSEVIQAQHYAVGQQFKAHTDYFETHEMQSHGTIMGQRSYTFMIYLNEVEDGGETVFPNIDLSVKPTLGMALIWNNLGPDGKGNYHSLHQAKPVTAGNKVIITKWFRQNSTMSPAPPISTKEANEYIPAYTKTGMIAQSFPPALFQLIRTFYQENRLEAQDENVPGNFISNADNNGHSSSLIELSPRLKQQIHDAIKPLMEQWCGEKLEPTFVYGIRIYKEKAVLKPHRDRLETHIISAIINVDQDVNQDWPLSIEDNFYREHHVLLKPGDMFFYEGGRLKHGRPQALNGSCFANIFCHFKPVKYVLKP